MSWLLDGVKPADRKNYAAPESAVDLYADFLICPTEPLKKGSVQPAKILKASHRRYIRVD
jgi:hypothetical protein